MMPQFNFLKKASLGSSHFQKGVLVFSIGMIKKVLIADTLAGSVNEGFANPLTLDFWGAWSVSVGYSMQLYFDFSGYSDMALGLALMFGVLLPKNFNSPYKALSVQDFWRRWHMTLSRFLRDYIYIPLGGSRKGYKVEYGALLITFLIGGIWHGAGLTFIIWGLLHGIVLVLERLLKAKQAKSITWMRRLGTLTFVNFSWIFFRSPDVETAFQIIRRMVTPGHQSEEIEKRIVNELAWWPSGAEGLPIDLWARLPLLILLAALLVIVVYAPNSIEIMERTKSPFVYYLVISVAAFGLLWGLSSGQQIFLYFNF
jgi:D-alanyl-lipoteichoic acid acyltransferase DltB (MBOAT superfamily)